MSYRHPGGSVRPIDEDIRAEEGLTSQEAENSDGDTKTVSLKKDYEVYITVK